MSVLLRTISAFPTGRTTSELFVLLDIDFDPRKRTEIYAELSSLSEAGKVSKGRDGRWRPVATSKKLAAAAPQRHATEIAATEDQLLRPVHATFRSSAAKTTDLEVTEGAVSFDPNALLRYYRSALRSDPRGAITQVEDRHAVSWQLFTGLGPLTPVEGEVLTISIPLEELPDEFRKALVKREANEQTLAVGWPIGVGKKQGVPVVWPVGLISAEWTRSSTHLEVSINTDDIVANPDWIKGVARTANWKEAGLREVFTQAEGLGFRQDEFLARLKEAVAGTFSGAVSGQQMRIELDPNNVGIHDIAALFLPTDTTFTAGAVRDLDAIAFWSPERLAATALAPILGLEAPAPMRATPVINTGDLNKEQIDAVRQSLSSPLTVVTGPPGTGKSQAIVSIAASVLADGGSVLVASKNHQALDAVESRLGGIAPKAPFLVRTLDPNRDIDQSFDEVLGQLISEPTKGAADPDVVLRSKLSSLAQIRTRVLDQIDEQSRIHSAIAEVLERIEAEKVKIVEPVAPVEASVQRGAFSRLVEAFLRALGLRKNSPGTDASGGEGATLVTLMRRLEQLRSDVSKIDIKGDPVAITQEIGELSREFLPRVLASAVNLTETDRRRLGEELANLQLAQSSGPLPQSLAGDVVGHRPLWLVSVLGASKRVPLSESLFDLAIFDEASQCDIASALPIFARAKRAVVVGDNRQLSFIRQLGIAHDRNLMQAQGLPIGKMGRFAQSRRSLFDLADLTPGASKVMLRDQYRSAADIVGYINEHFYGGQLRVAGDQDKLKVPKGGKPGIEWAHVPAPTAPMVGNVNGAEVAAITKHLKFLLEDQAYAGSIGVIAPFRPQVYALEQSILATLRPELVEKAELRVGTVDSFQGQERDLILFSTCLGHSSATSAMTFVQKDWRRLNVAISRARAVAHVFGDLSYARSGKVRSLQRLAAAATEPRGRVGEGTFDSNWERIVDKALRDRGLNPIPQHEVAGRRLDFALFGRGNIKLDLEVDGRHWHSDTDGKRKLADYWRDHQLQSLGWTVQRFWVDELERDLEKCIDRVAEQLS
ncbi:AAA domain-containing protein [Aliirhizobium cellulosilyticum]|uniref:Very-short-patch-repair endonuclease n=1 Tax=Aliirhizobium cellulosilyticum TaxID=393664 RepID=A0A7W6XB82_9HYPH|nr:AAA domain-containing protein [Rhizobium cellulosilyticum]MBB4349328.1 very-short-patch-repair endonuclease [Rhizobium cellulosilyticum]MBB4412450.1 very-short-patch-repair endonuclease [Rhizobium cellulosilyticum]MBB4447082.1 very-short-patch-repair endonuclease [Rhizobium cellulosilyticum]